MSKNPYLTPGPLSKFHQDRAMFQRILRAQRPMGLYEDFVKLVGCSWCNKTVEKELLGCEVLSICIDCYFDHLTKAERQLGDQLDREAREALRARWIRENRIDPGELRYEREVC